MKMYKDENEIQKIQRHKFRCPDEGLMFDKHQYFNNKYKQLVFFIV